MDFSIERIFFWVLQLEDLSTESALLHCSERNMQGNCIFIVKILCVHRRRCAGRVEIDDFGF